jgi:hypothetical protein
MIVPVALPSTLWAKALATSSAGRPEEGSIFSASSVSVTQGGLTTFTRTLALWNSSAKSAMSGSATGVAGVVSRVPAEQAQALQSGPKTAHETDQYGAAPSRAMCLALEGMRSRPVASLRGCQRDTFPGDDSCFFVQPEQY